MTKFTDKTSAVLRLGQLGFSCQNTGLSCKMVAECVWSCVYLIEADDVGVLQQLHDLHLSEDLFQVFVIQLGLIHNFYSHLEKRTRRRWRDEE